MTTTQPDNNYMKGIGRSEIAAEYNKDLRYADIRPMISFAVVE